MKRFLLLFLCLVIAVSCDSGYLESESKEELVVEGWIEDGHAPVVLVSSSLPVSSDPQPIENIKDHILRYAKVYVECDGVRHYLTARLDASHTVQNNFTSSTLRGEAGKTYTLGVEWKDYVATAVCTIPRSIPIDSAWVEKQRNDTSYVAKIKFRNNPEEKMYYQSFFRSNRLYIINVPTFQAINFTALDGSLLGSEVTETFMRPNSTDSDYDAANEFYFHKDDKFTIKLATVEKTMYDFWSSYDNLSYGSSVLTTPVNLKGNVEGAIGYWAGYGVSTVDFTIPDEVTINDSSSASEL